MPTSAAHAKINLWLHVFDRGTDGFHDIDTLFCRLALHDDITIEPAAPGIDLTVEGADLGDVRHNLVVLAAQAYYESTGIAPAISISLHKRIPAGGGLGGGSSDAAATLCALDDMHGCPLGRDGLLDAALRVGSDVPFFVTGAALALARGRGERLQPLPALPVAPVLVVAPAAAISTADAYAALDAAPDRPSITRAAHAVDTSTLHTWSDVAQLAVNDFEGIAIERLPVLRDVRSLLRENGASIALLCGSGSAMFGVFDDERACKRAQHAIASAGLAVRTLLTRTGVDPVSTPI